jgi:transposase
MTSWELAEVEARHSIVRPPDHRAGNSNRDTKGSTTEVALSGIRNSESADGEVVLGVDTHLDFHEAVAFHLGRRLGEVTVPTTTKGCEGLLCWAADEFGVVNRAGVEGTSSYGAGLARYLTYVGVAVSEVERPKRRHLGRNGKSDPIDAGIDARAVLAGETAGAPKSADGHAEMIRALRIARRSAVKARS